MSIETENSIKEIADRLPVEMVTAINDTPWVEKIKQIAKDNNLDKEKENSFAIETTLLVFGAVSPINYPDNLAENVGLDDDAVIKIAKEVDEKILAPIIQILKEKGFAPETVPSNLPMIEEGEVAHDVAHVEPTIQPARQDLAGSEKEKVNLPDYRYEVGKDPYREPLV